LGNPPSSKEASDKRVLVVEDDATISALLTKVLSQHYRVVSASDGAQALAQAERFQPQLVILDVMMPGMDGYMTAQRLRMLPVMKNVPLIFLTAKGGPMDVVKGIQAGARFYLTKPFKMAELLAKVKKALGE
jgi:DNA-binding response OmpR family regulator